MCLIVDANAAAEFLARKGAVIDWLLGPKGRPRLCVGGKLTLELERVEAVRRVLVQLDRAGRLRKMPAITLQGPQRRLRSGKACRSNDLHVIALAIVSGARALATFDEALSDDFKNPRIINCPRGSIYRTTDKHAHLLRHTPKSCGVRET